MRNIGLLFSILVFMVICGCNPRAVDYFTEVNNGGIGNVPKEFSRNTDFFRQLKPGSTIAYWSDSILNINFPPSTSNRVSTQIKRDFITEIVFFNTKEEGNLQRAEIDHQAFDIMIDSDYFSLISEIRSLGIEQEILLSELIRLFLQVEEYQTMLLFDFLNEIKKLGLISEIAIQQLVAHLIEVNLYRNIEISEFINLIKNFDFSLYVFLSELMLFVKTFSIDIDFDFTQLDFILMSEGIAKETMTGKPVIELIKNVNKSIAYYGNELIYSIHFKNIGEMAASDIIILDSLPKNVILRSTKIKGVRSRLRKKKIDGNLTLYWRIKALNPQESGTIEIRVELMNPS